MKTEHIRIVGGAMCFFAESSANVQWSLRVGTKYQSRIRKQKRKEPRAA